jgi:hypothetical protein
VDNLLGNRTDIEIIRLDDILNILGFQFTIPLKDIISNNRVETGEDNWSFY